MDMPVGLVEHPFQPAPLMPGHAAVGHGAISRRFNPHQLPVETGIFTLADLALSNALVNSIELAFLAMPEGLTAPGCSGRDENHHGGHAGQNNSFCLYHVASFRPVLQILTHEKAKGFTEKIFSYP
jgi:hypothetical protein